MVQLQSVISSLSSLREMESIWLPSLVNNCSYTWSLVNVTATGFFLLKPSILIPLFIVSPAFYSSSLLSSESSPVPYISFSGCGISSDLSVHLNQPEAWLQHRVPASHLAHSHVSDSIELGKSLRICTLNRFLWDADSANLGNILRKPLGCRTLN